ncbi:MAG: hypothetical protein PHG67_06180 [Bacteroidales bacterium]|jgi:hypothetical protein|nr:hypothetical protein [Bacteroidales bacterium]HOI32012.1 hypothetical protein [Bacteroidales bacterium]
MSELKGQATPEQIEAWKKKHGKVFAVKVDGHIGYLKKPDRRILSYATLAGSTDPIKFNETMLNNCWLGGSEAIKTDDDLFLGVSGKLAELIQVKEAELVNL